MWPSDAVWNEFDDETFNWGGLERFSRTLSRDNSLPLTPEEWRNFIKKIAIPPNKFLINKMIGVLIRGYGNLPFYDNDPSYILLFRSEAEMIYFKMEYL